MLEIAFSGIIGTLLGVLLGFGLEKWRDKDRERREREAAVIKIRREVADITNFLKSVSDNLSNPHLESVIQVAQFVTSIVPPGYSIFSTKASRNAPTLTLLVEQELEEFRKNLAFLEALGREIMNSMPPPMALRDPMMPPAMRQDLGVQAERFVERARELVNKTVQRGEAIVKQLR